MKILFFLLLFPLFVSAQTDSTLTIPLWMGRKVESDLRTKDALDTLVQIQNGQIKFLDKQIVLLDSIHTLDSLQRRTQNNIIRSKTNDATAYKSEVTIWKRKAKRNGWFRNVFIGTTLLFVWLTVKP